MNLKEVDIVRDLSPEQFKMEYFRQKPVVLRGLSSSWNATQNWTWERLKKAVGPIQVGVYSNEKNPEDKPVHAPHAYMQFDEYIDSVVNGTGQWRLFLFSILEHAPELLEDFEWPDKYFDEVLRRYPMLFTGAKGCVTHLHFDMDLSDVMQTQFIGKKRVLLFPYEEQHRIYRRPFEVMSLVDFKGYYNAQFEEKLDRFPALKQAKGYDITLEHGDTLYMPSKFWHHMEYLEAGMGLSLRSWQTEWKGKLSGLYHIILMRKLDGFMKKNAPDMWYKYKLNRIKKKEASVLSASM